MDQYLCPWLPGSILLPRIQPTTYCINQPKYSSREHPTQHVQYRAYFHQQFHWPNLYINSITLNSSLSLSPTFNQLLNLDLSNSSKTEPFLSILQLPSQVGHHHLKLPPNSCVSGSHFPLMSAYAETRIHSIHGLPDL